MHMDFKRNKNIHIIDGERSQRTSETKIANGERTQSSPFIQSYIRGEKTHSYSACNSSNSHIMDVDNRSPVEREA